MIGTVGSCRDNRGVVVDDGALTPIVERHQEMTEQQNKSLTGPKQMADGKRPTLRPLLTLIVISVVLGLTLSFVISFMRVLQVIDTRAVLLGLDGLRVPLIVVLSLVVTGVGLTIWWRPRFSVICLSIVGFALFGFGLHRIVRIESFYGNMVPKFTWRWAPEAEDYFGDYELTRPVSSTIATNVNELQTTDQDFSGFLGANRDGVIRGVILDEDWTSRPPELLWRHAVGIGWSGFAVVGDLAITQEQRGDHETVVAYDAMTGQEVWVHTDRVRFVDEHGDGPRAVPAYHDGYVYTLGATGLLSCLNGVDGRLVWQQQALADHEKNNLLWGMSGSPLVTNGLVIVTPGGGERQAIKAYDAKHGDLVWSNGDDSVAYASPAIVELAGEPLLLSFNGAGLRGFSVDGDPLWLYPWITQGESQRVNVAQPIVVTENVAVDDDAGYVLISSGYAMGMALVRVDKHPGHEWTVDTIWHETALKSKMSNFVVFENSIYGFDNGIFTCVDLQDGRRNWKKGRFGHGQVLRVNDHLLVQAESGDVYLLKATPERYTQLGKLSALEGKTWNHASLAGNLLLVRNDREAACYRLPTLDN